MDDFKIHTTKEGSLSLYSCSYKEVFHDKDGALRESIAKYLIPAQIDQFITTKKIVILYCVTSTRLKKVNLIYQI